MRVVVVLAQEQYWRNYISTNALSELKRHHVCDLVVTDAVKVPSDYPGTVHTVRVDHRAERAHYNLFNVLMWRHRGKSRTFRYRFSRLYRTYPNTSVRNVLRNLRGLGQAARYALLGNRMVGRLSIPILTRRVPINQELRSALERLNPDLVVFPCSAYDPIGNDIARIANDLRFKALFLVDNWDNLSSKSIFWVAPQFLGVWGEQSRDHAVRIHGIDPRNVFLLGTPRFDGYFRLRADEPKSPHAFRYVLFCGAAIAFDELSALRILDDEMAMHPGVYDDIRIVYRPHPYRQTRLVADEFREADFRRVVIDPQVADAYYRHDRSFHPPVDYYPGLLANAELVICPLTTMLVESLICGTPVLALAYDDHVHFTSPHNALRYYLHFEGLERLVGLELVHEQERLGQRFRAGIASIGQLDQVAVDASLQHILFMDGRTYAERLRDAADSIEVGRSIGPVLESVDERVR